MLFKFFDQWRSIPTNRFVLNMVQGHHLQLRSCPPLFSDFWHFNVKVAAASHPVIQKELISFLLREQYNLPQVVLVSVPACLWYLSVLGAFDPYSTWNVLIVICTYLFLRCQLLNMYGSFSSRVIMPFPLIYRMLIYMFLLLSIIIISYILFGVMCLISGRFYLLGLPQPLGFLCPSPNLFCSFAIAKVCVLLSILDDILVLICSKWVGRRAHLFLCSLLVHLGLHINFFQVWPSSLSDLYFCGVMLG